MTCFEKSLLPENVAVNIRCGLKASETADFACISLRKWCVGVVIDTSQEAYFGDCLSEIDPHLAQTFLEFDTRSWQLLYHFPRLISEPMYAAKDRLINALTAYFETATEKKANAAWVTQLFKKKMRGLGFTDKEMETLMMLNIGGETSFHVEEIIVPHGSRSSINTNLHKACFWMLSYMLFKPGLLEVIRTETAEAFVNDSLNFH